MIPFPRALTLAAALLASSASAAAQPAFPAPPPEAAASGNQVAVLAGGCFWGMEGLFEHVKGVVSVTAGYAGGARATADYEAVSTETTGHAESIRISYDPRQISYGQLLMVYFAAAHDPTEVNGQRPDSGPSYRSAIFAQNPAQRALAAAYIATLNKAHVFARPIATRIENGQFYAAEAYHQHFMALHPTHPYIVMWDVPRLQHFRARFPGLYRG